MDYKGKPLDRDQLIFMVELSFVSAWDRIDATLPDNATENQILDFHDRQGDGIVETYTDSVAIQLPILYATLTDDGMGVGEFNQMELFEAEVAAYVSKKLDPNINGPGNHLCHPDARHLAEKFVDQYLGEYLMKHLQFFKYFVYEIVTTSDLILHASLDLSKRDQSFGERMRELQRTQSEIVRTKQGSVKATDVHQAFAKIQNGQIIPN